VVVRKVSYLFDKCQQTALTP